MPTHEIIDDCIRKVLKRVLAAKRTDPQADVGALEQEIHARVYRLYGLTPAEFKLVEEGAPGI